ncbi:MAG: thiamine pyrophosphate-dependent enzyme [Candidatus Gastranaerophilales bacterium]|nr:thiamine pyrophosphate-dependent enzyme [Candidatus Gastranaerophilales bacterium]
MSELTKENIVFQRPKTIKSDYDYTFCAGCGHGIVLRLVAECLDELKVSGNTIAVASVGCSICLEKYYDLDVVGSSHGRAPCVATGVKRAKPDKIVFTYQGDGDAATIGMNETIHTACRGENITTICINNTNFGMTGGQASATTVIGQKTATTTNGRNSKDFGFPLRVSEMVALCEGACYVERCAIYNPKSVIQTKRAIKQAFENQLEGLGFSFVEVVCACPTGWKMTPVESLKYIENELIKTHKLGIFKGKRYE